jgi:hypothetical protein
MPGRRPWLGIPMTGVFLAKSFCRGPGRRALDLVRINKQIVSPVNHMGFSGRPVEDAFAGFPTCRKPAASFHYPKNLTSKPHFNNILPRKRPVEPIPQTRANDTRKRYSPSISPSSAQNPYTGPRMNAQNPYQPKPSVLIDHPDWSKNATIYQINTRQFTDEGTFRAAERHLPRLKELGVVILWLMPVNEIGEKPQGHLGKSLCS